MPLVVKRREAVYYKTTCGKEPVYDYLKRLEDPVGRAKIQIKISRAERGNFGQEGKGYRHIEGDIWELKVDCGPGYRVYFALDRDELILLLAVGDKRSQGLDIKKAQKYWAGYKSRKWK
ncbi:MAG: type II toxin-antitoxin system RelE/ParE family toxin [Pseudobdellovibrionaceae bacterium]|nr:type II toxin-antitoxin system RelE/ParE family toxin [Bdellovibrionales bacterium]USN48794.1 MAG: type II toxin-antitoxin system RelE/ParE family toxin [Pseudobdellovibrionaceae bacterium]